MTRLSHSALEKFKSCKRMYKLHYIDKIRDIQIGSPLFFGSAIDEALNILLLRKMKKENMSQNDIELSLKCPYEKFDLEFQSSTYNKENIFLPFSLKCRYSSADFDEDLLEEDDILDMKDFLKENGYEDIQNPVQIMLNIKKYIKNHSYMDLDQIDQTYYNYCNWLSMKRKGHLMIKAYEEQLLPQIYEVISIQKLINFNNGEGDTMVGFIDFEAILYDKNGKPEPFIRVCDNKTSSRKYKDDSIKESQQLTIYCEARELENAAYFVLNKTVKKISHKTCKICGETTTGREKSCKNGGVGKNRCNGDFNIKIICSIDTQIIKDSIKEEQKEITFASIQDILTDIKYENFEKNNKEDCYQFGRKCIYYERCWNDSTSLKGLYDPKN